MEVKDADQRRSVAANARRAQIVAAAIDTIADLGYRQASFAKIAERAGLSSTRLISYHFANRDELIAEVVHDVMDAIVAHMTERMSHAHTATELLATYLRGTVEFIGAHRARMTALAQIVVGGGMRIEKGDLAQATEPLIGILRAGQEAGEFRAFDLRVMATTVQRSLDGLPFVLHSDPDLDTDHYAEELVTLFGLATRVTP